MTKLKGLKKIQGYVMNKDLLVDKGENVFIQISKTTAVRGTIYVDSRSGTPVEITEEAYNEAMKVANADRIAKLKSQLELAETKAK